MSFTVHITKVETGETRIHAEPGLQWDEYHWTEGNFGCDCNRTLFFSRAAGEPEDWMAGCTEGKFTIRVTDADGDELYVETQPLSGAG